MAEIKKFPFVRHLRGEPSSYILKFRRGRVHKSGPGLSFWFRPLSAAIVEVPIDDRELPFLFHGRSVDFQDVTVQGVITYRVVDAEKLARRVDFGIDLRSGVYLREPLDRLGLLLTQLAQQLTQAYLAQTPLRVALIEGYVAIRDRLGEGLADDPGMEQLGVEIVSVRISSIRPTGDLEKALEAPIREEIQQQADEATFQRRAMAVEKERAIQENELKNRIELARKEEELIAQEGQNQRRSAQEAAQAGQIEAEGRAARLRIEAAAEAEKVRLAGAAQAESIRLVETARAEAEAERMKAYRDLPPAILFGLAAQQLGNKLEKIDHLNLSSEMMVPLVAELLKASTRRLSAEDKGEAK